MPTASGLCLLAVAGEEKDVLNLTVVVPAKTRRTG